MYYHSYPEDGYEAGPAAIGMAWCEEEDLMTWHRMPEPILTIENGASWEAGGLYKNCLVEKDGKYYLFYNAKNSPGDGSFWKEQIGVAVGDSPFQFVRWKGNPLLTIEPKKWDSCFCSDPWVVWDKNQWVMFYYGFDGQHAMDGIAVSQDLLHWEKSAGAYSPLRCTGRIGRPCMLISPLFIGKTACCIITIAAARKSRNTRLTLKNGPLQ